MCCVCVSVHCIRSKQASWAARPGERRVTSKKQFCSPTPLLHHAHTYFKPTTNTIPNMKSSNNKHKLSDSDHVAKKPKSDDSDGLTHVYLKPKHLIDVEVRYDKHVFHAHKGILALYSSYFSALFKSASQPKAVDLPLITTAMGYEIKGEDLKVFLDEIYEPTRCNDLEICLKCVYPLTQFFECTWGVDTEAKIKQLIKDDADPAYLDFLFLLLEYKREQKTVDLIVAHVGNFIQKIKLHQKYQAEQWTRLPESIRQKIYEIALEKYTYPVHRAVKGKMNQIIECNCGFRANCRSEVWEHIANPQSQEKKDSGSNSDSDSSSSSDSD